MATDSTIATSFVNGDDGGQPRPVLFWSRPLLSMPAPGKSKGRIDRDYPRVAPRCIGAPHEHARHLCHRILSKACPGFLTVPQGGMSAPPAISRAEHAFFACEGMGRDAAAARSASAAARG